MKQALVLLLLAGFVLVGCAKDNKQAEQTEGQQAATEQAAGQTEQGAGNEQATSQEAAGQATQKETKAAPAPPKQVMPPKQAPPKQAPSQPAAQSEPEMVTRLVPVPAGAQIVAELDETVSTETAKAGSPFTAVLKEPYTRGGIVLVPAGSKVHGVVAAAKRAGRIGGKAEMTLEFKTLDTPQGQSYSLFADPLALEGKGSTEGDVGKVVGGAVGGAIVGGILGGKEGAGKGAAAGGAAGAAWAVATRGQDIVLDPGSKVSLTLTREFEVPVQMRADQPLP